MPTSTGSIEKVAFDDIDHWASELSDALSEHVSPSAKQALINASPQNPSEAMVHLFQVAPRSLVVGATVGWIESVQIMAFHGSRLSDSEVACIERTGLTPLIPGDRKNRLTRALCIHPDWLSVQSRLASVIAAHGSGCAAGRRKGQVHLTLSCEGLRHNFNHYLTYGSEFDQHVAYALLGQEGKDLLALDGTSTIVKAAIPGKLALDSANRHLGVAAMIARGEVPNIVRELLAAWSVKQAHSNQQSGTLRVDCGIVLTTVVPPAWIVSLNALEIPVNT